MKYLLLAIFTASVLSCKTSQNSELSDVHDYKGDKHRIIVAAKGEATFDKKLTGGHSQLSLAVPGFWNKKVRVMDYINSGAGLLSVYSAKSKFELVVLCSSNDSIAEDFFNVAFSLFERNGKRFTFASEVNDGVQEKCIASAIEAEPRLKEVLEDYGLKYGLEQGMNEIFYQREPIKWDNSRASVCNTSTFKDATKMVQHCQSLSRSCEQCLSMCAGERLTPGTKKLRCN